MIQVNAIGKFGVCVEFNEIELVDCANSIEIDKCGSLHEAIAKCTSDFLYREYTDIQVIDLENQEVLKHFDRDSSELIFQNLMALNEYEEVLD